MRRRHLDLPLGTMQLCLPLKAEPATNEASGEGAAPVAARFDRFARYLTTAYRDLGLQAAYTPEHCRKLERLLVHIQPQIREGIALLEQPEYLHDQRMLSRLWLLHLHMVESFVLVRSVCGLCATGRQMTEPTGAYWQLVDYVRGLLRDCQMIARFVVPASVTMRERASA